MKGLPASGKSTKAEELLKTMGNAVRLNKDLLRTMLHFNVFNRVKEGKTQDASIALTRYFLTHDTSVVIDDTNLNPKVVESWKTIAKECNAKIEYVDCFDVSVEECIRRDDKRAMKKERHVGRHVIIKMALQYHDYMKGRDVIICDLDGTLCDCEHRKHFLQGEKKDWTSFFNHLNDDYLRGDILDKLMTEMRNTYSTIIFVSARPEDYRIDTIGWMYDNIPIENPILIMRESNDKRPDTEVKNDIYEKYLKNLNIVKVFDDRPSVIRMWREKGLEVEDCGSGIEF